MMKGFLMNLAVLALGGLIGASVALLYAPRSGRTTRAMLYTRGRLLKDEVEQELAVARKQVRHRARDVARTTREMQATVDDLGERLHDVVEHPREALREAVQTLPVRANGR
jgi:gas vesicle protein